MTERTLAAIQAERFRSTLNQHKCRACPTCVGLDAAAHPLAVGAVVTVLQLRKNCVAIEGIATILGTALEPDTYFIRFRSGDVRVRPIFPEYQRDPARMIYVFNRHLKEETSDDASNSSEVGEENS